MGLLGRSNNGETVSAEDLPRPSTTHSAAIFEIRDIPGGGATFVIHTRNDIQGFPMDLEYLELFIAKGQEVIRQKKAPALSVVESGKEVILPDGATA